MNLFLLWQSYYSVFHSLNEHFALFSSFLHCSMKLILLMTQLPHATLLMIYAIITFSVLHRLMILLLSHLFFILIPFSTTQHFTMNFTFCSRNYEIKKKKKNHFHSRICFRTFIRFYHYFFFLTSKFLVKSEREFRNKSILN